MYNLDSPALPQEVKNKLQEILDNHAGYSFPEQLSIEDGKVYDGGQLIDLLSMDTFQRLAVTTFSYHMLKKETTPECDCCSNQAEFGTNKGCFCLDHLKEQGPLTIEEVY